MKRIEVFSPCYNEIENIRPFYESVKAQFDKIEGYEYSHLFIDNCSTDGTVEELRKICKEDPRVRVILNSRNFGALKSPFYGLTQTTGDAVINMAVDFQDPPELIPQLIKEWESGFDTVVCVKNKSEESQIIYGLRKVYYKLVKKMSESEHLTNFTGFGLYSRQFMDVIKTIDDPYPYFRGIVSELASNYKIVYFTQPKRSGGKSKMNFYRLYDYAMSGFINQSKVPLRIASFIGYICAFASLIIAIITLIQKLIHWDTFSVGIAAVSVGLFFFASVQLIFIGIIGEYVGATLAQVRKRPLVIEKERINFDNEVQN